MNRINKMNDKTTTFGDLFNNLPIEKLWVIKSPEIWSDWSKTGVVTCKNITTLGKSGIKIPHIEPYLDGFFDVDDNHSYMIQDNIDGFYLFSDQVAAYSFFEYLKEEY